MLIITTEKCLQNNLHFLLEGNSGENTFSDCSDENMLWLVSTYWYKNLFEQLLDLYIFFPYKNYLNKKKYEEIKGIGSP